MQTVFVILNCRNVARQLAKSFWGLEIFMIERFDVNEEYAHSGIIKAGD